MLGQKGLSLIELIITIMIAGILLSMAVPNFREFIQNLNIETETNRLMKDIQMARAEAIARGKPVTICRSEKPGNAPQSTSAGADGDLTCGGGTPADWTTGWFTFIDLNSNGELDYLDDKLFSVSQAPTSEELEIFANNEAKNIFKFNSDGSTDADENIMRFAICDARGKDDGKLIEVPPVGRPRLADAVGNCSNGS